MYHAAPSWLYFQGARSKGGGGGGGGGEGGGGTSTLVYS